ncbi:MAG: hypothetical protein V2J24_09915 [Pseudomonadales bacterium]|jgi:hypothetical protein|nr:hypothetical protein [Pseudomonadales bacterium]
MDTSSTKDLCRIGKRAATGGWRARKVRAATLLGHGLLAAALAAGTAAFADEPRILQAKLVPTTGFNSDCDQPIFRLPAPLPADLHFDFVGLHDPAIEVDGLPRDAIALSPEDCKRSGDRRVATTSDPDFQEFLGFPPPDPRLLNLLSNQVPVITLPDGTRTFLPPQGALPPPFPPARSLPSEPQTLGRFRDVDGRMRIRCRADGTARVRIRVSGYDPNMLVTVGAVWLTTLPGVPGPIGAAFPFGGVPNVMPIDRNGNGVFVRELGYCPMDIQPDGSQLMTVAIDEHWDGSNYGAQPDLPFAEARFLLDPADPTSAFTSPIGAGVVAVNRGAFAVTVKPWH